MSVATACETQMLDTCANVAGCAFGYGLAIWSRFYSQQGVVDCAWSEENEFHIVSACGDGTIKLWDLVASAQDGFPLQVRLSCCNPST